MKRKQHSFEFLAIKGEKKVDDRETGLQNE
jgi:hypothetical protein